MNIKLESSSNNRSSIFKYNIFYSALIRGINILISLILVPLTIDYVNPELYGIWLSLSSIVSWFSLFDIGLGLGLRNYLTTALAFHKYKYGKILVSTTFFTLFATFALVGGFAYICCAWVDWAYVLSISQEYNAIVTISFQIVLIAFCLRMALQLVSNVCQAYQMTAMASGIDMVGNLLSLFFMWLLTKTMAPSLIWLSLALCMAPLAAYLVANVVMFSGKFKRVCPSILYVRGFVLKDITALGFKFFLIQIVCVILYQATNFIISHFCGPEQVTVYNIAFKYLNVALMGITIIQSPLWSAFNDAYAMKDYEWMRHIYRKLLSVVLLTELSLFIMVLVSPLVYLLWIGDSVSIPFHITILLGVYMGLLLVNNLHGMLVNGMGKIKLQTIMACMQGVCFLPIVYVLAIKYSLEGIIIALILVTLIPTYQIIKQVVLLLKREAGGIYNS